LIHGKRKALQPQGSQGGLTASSIPLVKKKSTRSRNIADAVGMSFFSVLILSKLLPVFVDIVFIEKC